MKPKFEGKDLQGLVDLGREQGYLTFDQVNDFLPQDVASPADIRAALDSFEDLDIKVLEEVPSADGTEVEFHGEVSPVAAPCNPRRSGHPVPAADQPWPEQWRRWVRQERPNVVMILAGRWEVMNRTYHGRWTDILHPAYAAYVKRQLELAVGVAGSDGARVVLLTAPCYDSGLQPDGEPWPEDDPARVDAYNRLVDQVAAEQSGSVSVIDLHAMVCPGGRYHQVIDGVTVRDPADGVHFTLSGGDFLASRIWPTAARLGRQQLAALARASVPRG